MKSKASEEKDTNGGALPPLHATLGSRWSSEMPTEEGCYWMTCMENDGKPDYVPVYRKRGMLLCDPPGIGAGYPLWSVHNGLTDTKWRPAIKITENAKDQAQP